MTKSIVHGYEINRELVLSTAHITKNDNNALMYACIANNFSGLIVDELSGGFGYRIIINADEVATLDYVKADLSPQFANLIDTAIVKQCKYLVLDCDGLTHDALDTFNW